MDQGIQNFRLLLVPHKNTWRESNIAKLAEEFSAPLIPIYQGIHGGTMPKSGSYLSVNSDHVLVTSVKLSEKNENVIVRCVETAGIASRAALDLQFAKSKWTGNFKPYEIKSLLVDGKGGVKEVNLLEE